MVRAGRWQKRHPKLVAAWIVGTLVLGGNYVVWTAMVAENARMAATSKAVLEKIWAESERDAARADAQRQLQRSKRTFITQVLARRFTSIPQEVESALQHIQDEARLDELLNWAFDCPDVPAFAARLSAARS